MNNGGCVFLLHSVLFVIIEILKSTQNITVSKDDRVQISVSGVSAADVQWKKDGQLIDFSIGRYKILDDGSLEIRNVQKSDEGRYTIWILTENLESDIAEVINVKILGILSPFLLEFSCFKVFFFLVASVLFLDYRFSLILRYNENICVWVVYTESVVVTFHMSNKHTRKIVLSN